MMVRPSALGLVLAAALLSASCYNPQIADGGLKCGPASQCPSGFTCSRDGFCVKPSSLPTGGSGGPGGMGGGAGGMGGMGGGAGGMGGGVMACTMPSGMYGPFPSCEASVASGCDPVCQTGCPCEQRCKLEGGIQACRMEGPNFTQPNQDCDPRNDTCRPGSICLQESKERPACGAHCYRHCTKDEQCDNARCSVDITFGDDPTKHRVCSPPRDTCDPWASLGMPARCSNPVQRPFPIFGCYVQSGEFPDNAICDCAGNTKINEPCQYEHQCEPGAECVAINMIRLCRKVCRLGAQTAANGACPGAMICSPFMKSNVYGYCHL